MTVPMIIMMVMPAQAVDILGSTQGFNVRVVMLFLTDDGGNFRVMSIAVDIARHFLIMIVVGMLIIVVVIGMVVIVVIGVLMIIVVIGMLVIVVIGMLIIVVVIGM
ncbi:MAG: hypothetical protein OXG23_02195, partial [Chloroflexi bacterium]|nr:hypothetical protein [Chloroflexota bacterium]